MTTKIVLVSLLVVACLGLVYLYFGGVGTTGGVSLEEAGDLGLAYINNVLLQPGLEATLTDQMSEESGLYKYAISLDGQETDIYITKDGKTMFTQIFDISEQPADLEQEEEGSEGLEKTGTTLGNFTVYNTDVCMEDGLPVVYFFGSEGCGFCQWEHPVMEAVAANFEGLIAFHNNMDSDEDMDIFSQYSTGGIPTLVLGCKYGRTGAGKNAGEEVETENLTALICDLTNGQPASVCAEVQDVVDQINPQVQE